MLRGLLLLLVLLEALDLVLAVGVHSLHHLLLVLLLVAYVGERRQLLLLLASHELRLLLLGLGLWWRCVHVLHFLAASFVVLLLLLLKILLLRLLGWSLLLRYG